MIKEENTLINIAICDDDLVFASKIEAMLLQISKKQMIKMNIEVFSDGSELWDDIAVLGILVISAVSATFFQNFSIFWAGLGCCFSGFMDYSYPSKTCQLSTYGYCTLC